MKVFREVAPMPTENIGPVAATCGADIGEADCMRTLMDQVCRLGGDVVWGVSDVPSQVGKRRLAGRAALGAQRAPVGK